MSTTEIGVAPAGAAPAAVRSGGARATLGAIYVLWYRDMLRFWRDRARIIGSFAQPLLYLVVFGTGLSSSLGAGAFGGELVGIDIEDLQ